MLGTVIAENAWSSEKINYSAYMTSDSSFTSRSSQPNNSI
jgi:hypothetical protein